MEEYSDIKTIEDLYNEEEISGKSYLFCVDNDIDTLQDLRKFIAEASSCENIPDDLRTFATPISIELCHSGDGNVDLQNDKESFSIDNFILQKYEDIYTSEIKEYSVRAQNCIARIASEYNYPSDEFFNYLLAPGLETRLLSIRNSGKKTIKEICDMVECIKEGLDNHNLYPAATIDAYSQLKFEQGESLSDILFIIDPMKTKYSVRCQNVINKIISDNNNSIVRLYNYFRSTEYSPNKIRNIGKKTSVEL